MPKFFEKSEEDCSCLFNGLEITLHSDCMKHQRQYPVIFLSLKDIKGTNWETAYAEIINKISCLYRENESCRNVLYPEQDETYERLCLRKASLAEV